MKTVVLRYVSRFLLFAFIVLMVSLFFSCASSKHRQMEKEQVKIETKTDIKTETKTATEVDTKTENQTKEESKPYRDWETDRKSTRLNSSHSAKSRMPSSA